MGTSSVSSQSGSEELQRLDMRKRKRMLSNRESARRSRQRKQKRLDDLTAQVSQVSNQNAQILATTNVTTQLYMNLEAENSVLRAQLAELTHRLHSLNEIILCLSPQSAATAAAAATASSESEDVESFGSLDLEFDQDGFDVMNAWGVSFATPAMDAFMC